MCPVHQRQVLFLHYVMPCTESSAATHARQHRAGSIGGCKTSGYPDLLNAASPGMSVPSTSRHGLQGCRIGLTTLFPPRGSSHTTPPPRRHQSLVPRGGISRPHPARP
jgi:hypothetical protein